MMRDSIHGDYQCLMLLSANLAENLEMCWEFHKQLEEMEQEKENALTLNIADEKTLHSLLNFRKINTYFGANIFGRLLKFHTNFCPELDQLSPIFEEKEPDMLERFFVCVRMYV